MKELIFELVRRGFHFSIHPPGTRDSKRKCDRTDYLIVIVKDMKSTSREGRTPEEAYEKILEAIESPQPLDHCRLPKLPD